MKAAAIDEFGPPTVLTVHTLPVPEVGPSEVLIAVYAAGVGIWDAKIRDGTWAEREDFPMVLGTDGSGVVAANGTRVRRFELGDVVWAYRYDNPKGGFYAEFVAVDANQVAHKPKRLGFREAGAAAVTGLTALQGVDDHANVRRGETVLVFGATGAVGTLAVQLAKRKHARVLATATGRDAERLVKELGADAPIDARSAHFPARLEELAPDGLDAILAFAGGDALDRAIDHVREGGRVAFPNGVEPVPKERRNVRAIAYDASATPRDWARLEKAVDEARLKVPIAAAFPLAQAAKAHERLERGHVRGRIVLRVRRET